MNNLTECLKCAIVTDRAIQSQYPKMYSTFNSIEVAIQQAWDLWDDEITKTYHNGIKPVTPPDNFSLQWIENEDLEADGYDTEMMSQTFNV